MKAVCWEGINKVQVETVPDPKIINPRDAIVKIIAVATLVKTLVEGHAPLPL
jgi:threonine dehydrogenase-like Zn-dependent dehydrogenase